MKLFCSLLVTTLKFIILSLVCVQVRCDPARSQSETPLRDAGEDTDRGSTSLQDAHR